MGYKLKGSSGKTGMRVSAVLNGVEIALLLTKE